VIASIAAAIDLKEPRRWDRDAALAEVKTGHNRCPAPWPQGS
jgi:hypothetical protein